MNKKYRIINSMMIGVMLSGIMGVYFFVQSSPVPVRIALTAYPGAGLQIMAEEKGFFEEQGLAVTMMSYPSGMQVLDEALFPGKADLVTCPDALVALAATKKKTLRILAAVGGGDNINRIVARRDSGISTASDLNGKRIGTPKDSALHYFLYLVLAENGLKISDVQVYFAGIETLPAALEKGEVDAVTMREPYLFPLQNSLGNKVVTLDARGLYKQSELLVTTPQWLKNNTDVANAVLRALAKADIYVSTYPRESMRIISNYLPLYDTYSDTESTEYVFELGLPNNFLKLLENQSVWYAKIHSLEAPDRALFKSYIDSRALVAAQPSSVTTDF